MAGKLPDPILNRAKKGFPVPTERWLRTELRDWVSDSLLSSNAAVRNFMNPEMVKKVVSEHQEGRTNREQELWTLLTFETWHRTFVDDLCPPLRALRDVPVIPTALRA